MFVWKQNTCTWRENLNIWASGWNTYSRTNKVITHSCVTDGKLTPEHHCVGSSFPAVFAQTSGCGGSQHDAPQPNPVLQRPSPRASSTTSPPAPAGTQLLSSKRTIGKRQDMCKNINPTHTPGRTLLKSHGKRLESEDFPLKILI